MADDNTGAPGDQGNGTDGGQPPPKDDKQQHDDGLGDAGKRAIESERQARRTAERRAGDLEKELARIRESGMSEQEKAVEHARREAKAEAQKSFNTRIKQAEVRAAAAGKLADPEDAVLYLNLDLFDVDDDGKVDKKAVTKALDELVKAKPYLAASATRPTGDADQGARGGQAGSSMTDLIRRAAGR